MVTEKLIMHISILPGPGTMYL